jgi:hypothetical protein
MACELKFRQAKLTELTKKQSRIRHTKIWHILLNYDKYQCKESQIFYTSCLYNRRFFCRTQTKDKHREFDIRKSDIFFWITINTKNTNIRNVKNFTHFAFIIGGFCRTQTKLKIKQSRIRHTKIWHILFNYDKCQHTKR